MFLPKGFPKKEAFFIPPRAKCAIPHAIRANTHTFKRIQKQVNINVSTL